MNLTPKENTAILVCTTIKEAGIVKDTLKTHFKLKGQDIDYLYGYTVFNTSSMNIPFRIIVYGESSEKSNIATLRALQNILKAVSKPTWVWLLGSCTTDSTFRTGDVIFCLEAQSNKTEINKFGKRLNTNTLTIKPHPIVENNVKDFVTCVESDRKSIFSGWENKIIPQPEYIALGIMIAIETGYMKKIQEFVKIINSEWPKYASNMVTTLTKHNFIKFEDNNILLTPTGEKWKNNCIIQQQHKQFKDSASLILWAHQSNKDSPFSKLPLEMMGSIIEPLRKKIVVNPDAKWLIHHTKVDPYPHVYAKTFLQIDGVLHRNLLPIEINKGIDQGSYSFLEQCQYQSQFVYGVCKGVANTDKIIRDKSFSEYATSASTIAVMAFMIDSSKKRIVK